MITTPKKTKRKKPAIKKVAIQKPAYESHIFSVLVDNEPGVLARVIGLFSSRGYNIESLTVGVANEVTSKKRATPELSRITIITSGSDMVIDQIEAQLKRLVPVHRVANLTRVAQTVGRDLALVKVVGRGEKRVEALRMADVFGAKVVDSTLGSLVLEITGGKKKVDAFITLMQSLGAVESSRTGIAALARGEETF